MAINIESDSKVAIYKQAKQARRELKTTVIGIEKKPAKEINVKTLSNGLPYAEIIRQARKQRKNMFLYITRVFVGVDTPEPMFHRPRSAIRPYKNLPGSRCF